MKKYVLFTIGFTTPTIEIMEAWKQWFNSIGDKIVEQVGLMNGQEVTPNGISPLEMDKDAVTGYLVIQVENMEEAIKIAEACPMVTATRVYEIRS